MTEKYSLLPTNLLKSTAANTALQRLSQKQPDFELQHVNSIRPPEMENTRAPQANRPVPTDTTLCYQKTYTIPI